MAISTIGQGTDNDTGRNPESPEARARRSPWISDCARRQGGAGASDGGHRGPKRHASSSTATGVAEGDGSGDPYGPHEGEGSAPMYLFDNWSRDNPEQSAKPARLIY